MMIGTPCALRAALDALRLAPLNRPAIPAYDLLGPKMRRSPWLERARLEHRLLGMAVGFLNLYDSELPEIADEFSGDMREFSEHLATAEGHYFPGLVVIQATRFRVEGCLP